MRISLAFAVALVLLPVAAGAQQAPQGRPQVQCGPPAVVTANLQRQFGEVLQAVGTDDNGSLMQVYANANTGSWTVAMTLPGGPTCIVSTGDGFTRDPAPTWAAWAHDVAVWLWGRS